MTHVIGHPLGGTPRKGGGLCKGFWERALPPPLWWGHRAIKVKNLPLPDGYHIEQHETTVNMMTQLTWSEQAFYITILALQPCDRVAMLGVNTAEFFLEEFTWKWSLVPRGEKCACSWPPTWPSWRHVQTSNTWDYVVCYVVSPLTMRREVSPWSSGQLVYIPLISDNLKSI